MVRPLSEDTSIDIERRQVEAWRSMSAAERAATITGLTQAAFDMAAAGVKARHPGASEPELFYRMAVVVLGPELAARVHPDLSRRFGQR